MLVSVEVREEVSTLGSIFEKDSFLIFMLWSLTAKCSLENNDEPGNVMSGDWGYGGHLF